ncbi:MAG: penicillin-binding transpeptidase domain-containing protein, partial [Brooklawnia sp.]|jgi:cell division protein FtsI/penicillin-binding protein 2
VTRRWQAWWAITLAFVLAVAGCARPEEPEPPAGAPEVAELLARALTTGEFAGLPLLGDAEQASLDHSQATSGLAGLLPRVEVAQVSFDETGQQATVQLQHEYTFDHGKWTFASTAALQYRDPAWLIEWSPGIVHPELGPTTRLYHERTPAKRAPIIDVHGAGIVEDRQVYRVGIDKTLTEPEQVDESARALAELLKVDVEAYAAQVQAYGPQAFVPAITLRAGEVPAAIDGIPGAAAYAGTLPLAPSASFARGLLGTAGEATAEIIEQAGGAVQAGDIVGMSGLQAIHDEQLRGLPGHTITIIDRSQTQLAELPPPASPAPSPGPIEDEKAEDRVLFALEPVTGEPLQLTMDLELQFKAEQLLAGHDRLVMLVVVDRATGGIVVAASSPQSGAQPFVTTGRYAPGSTMKVVTALALLRKGYTPDTMVDCSATARIGGRIFHNYPGYPAALTGRITLRTALQESCNTAFMNEADRVLDGDDLAQAAASLGIGVDYLTGFDAFYGSVPTDGDAVQHAANSIGQGQVVASPMAMAAEAASIGAGRTVVPWLVHGFEPEVEATELSADEVEMLRDMTTTVVQAGTLADMQGVLTAGKSGTAEFTDDDPPRTHGWVVGYNDKYAVAAMDHDQRNSTVPQDVIRAFLA